MQLNKKRTQEIRGSVVSHPGEIFAAGGKTKRKKGPLHEDKIWTRGKLLAVEKKKWK